MNIETCVLITYYWPPASGPGVHRWLRLSRRWPVHQLALTVCIPDKAAYPSLDKELLESVPEHIQTIQVRITEPGQFLGFRTGVAFTSNYKKSIFSKFLAWVRGNLFLPDARILWVNQVVKKLKKEYLSGHFKYLITTGPPHSVHLAGLKLKKIFPDITWVADFRDPWLEVDYLKHLHLTPLALKIHRIQESQVLTNADAIVTISDGISSILRKKTAKPVYVIPNGIDSSLFDDLSKSHCPIRFNILHAGNMPAERDVPELWITLKNLDKPIYVDLVGHVDNAIIQSIRMAGIPHLITVKPPVSHKESLKLQNDSALLLVVANRTPHSKGILTGKIYEYLASGRPLLAIGEPGGDLEKLVKKFNAGWFIPYQDIHSCQKALEQAYTMWKEGKLESRTINLKEFDSGYLAQRFVEVLKTSSSH